MRGRPLLFVALIGCGGEGGPPDVELPCDDPGVACTWVGTGAAGFNNNNPDAHRLESRLYMAYDVTFGPDDRAYIPDWNNHRIRRVEPDDTLTVVMGTDYEGEGAPGSPDLLPLCNPVGAFGTEVAMNHPTDVEFGPDGRLYIAAWHNNRIWTFDPATDIVKQLAGETYGFEGDGGPACRAQFNQPKAVAIADDGTIYTVDQRNVRIRTIATDGTITTMAGTGVRGTLGDGGLAIDAEFGFDTDPTPEPSGSLVVDGRTLYVADSLNNRIRRIDLDTNLVDCIAGMDEAGYTGDGGPALQARFDFPADIELGPDGLLYVADRKNHVVRAIDLASGMVDTVAGRGEPCDGAKDESCLAPALASELGLFEPTGIAFDRAGNLYIADSRNSRIVKVTR